MKAKKAKLPKAAQISKSAAAGIAATTRGRARVFKDKRTAVKPARKQIDEQLGELE